MLNKLRITPALVLVALITSSFILAACDTLALSTPAASAGKTGLVAKVTMAEDTKDNLAEPVNPTTVFKPTAIFHAVVTTNNAKPNTKFKAAWYAVDVGTVVPPNSLIDQAEVTAEGTRNLDFFLKPDQPWPPGSYRVEVFANDALDRVITFSVK